MTNPSTYTRAVQRHLGTSTVALSLFCPGNSEVAAERPGGQTAHAVKSRCSEAKTRAARPKGA